MSFLLCSTNFDHIDQELHAGFFSNHRLWIIILESEYKTVINNSNRTYVIL